MEIDGDIHRGHNRVFFLADAIRQDVVKALGFLDKCRPRPLTTNVGGGGGGEVVPTRITSELWQIFSKKIRYKASRDLCS